jgi:hypothetical protein
VRGLIFRQPRCPITTRIIFQRRIRLLNRDQVRNPTHAVAMRTQVPIPLCVRGNGVVHTVLPAVDFDDELEFVAVEIGRVRTDRRLAAKLQAVKLAIAQPLPHAALAKAGIAAESLRAFEGPCAPCVRQIPCDHGDSPFADRDDLRAGERDPSLFKVVPLTPCPLAPGRGGVTVPPPFPSSAHPPP